MQKLFQKKLRRKCVNCGAFKYAKFMRIVSGYGLAANWICLNETKCILRANAGTNYGK